MRINLTTPFAEKDAAKALGARWDSAKKVWYITDVFDLAPFARWLPESESAAGNSDITTPARRPIARPPLIPVQIGKTSVMTRATMHVAHCGCDVLPWDDCVHTSKLRVLD